MWLLGNLKSCLWLSLYFYCIVLEKAMATHSSTLAWKIPWMEEPGRLQSMGSLRVGTTKQLHFHFSLSYIGEGNGNPLQSSCLENPRDGGSCWAAIYGVAQSRTRLKPLNSSRGSATLAKLLSSFSMSLIYPSVLPALFLVKVLGSQQHRLHKGLCSPRWNNDWLCRVSACDFMSLLF